MEGFGADSGDGAAGCGEYAIQCQSHYSAALRFRKRLVRIEPGVAGACQLRGDVGLDCLLRGDNDIAVGGERRVRIKRNVALN